MNENINTSKEYKVPTDLMNLMIERESILTVADKLYKLPFSLKKILKLNKKAETLRSDFWYNVVKLYPELAQLKLEYDYVNRVVRIANKQL